MSLITSERVNDIYHSIGQNIVDVLPEDFVTAWAYAEINDEFYSLELFYRKPNGRIGYIDDGLGGLERGFRDMLRESPDDNKWTSATFKLSSKGAMSIDFCYDDITDFEQAAERRNAWIAQYLEDPSAIDW